MLSALKRRGPQTALIFGVLLLCIANAVGLYEVLLDINRGASSYPAVLKYPEFLVLVGVGVVLSLLLPLLSPIKASLLVALATVPVIYLGFAPTPQRPLIPMEYSLLTILLLFAINLLSGYLSETQKKQQIIHAFGQYAPKELVHAISQNPDKFSLDGEARNLSVMFCDVDSFTTISERLEPRQLALLLNTLFTPLTEIIYKHGGTIDKYMGDAIMAFWGAPIPDADHARKALIAAFDIQDALHELAPSFKAKGWPEIAMGIGINSGVMSVGNMGSKYRMAYTVVGDAVNLAARLQDLTRIYGARIIVGENTRQLFPAAFYRELGLVRVKGKDTLVRIYEPGNPAADPESTLVQGMHRHNQALRSYYERRWDEAEELFQTLNRARPEDPVYSIYLERIAEFRRNPPPEDWRGEIRYTVG